MNKNLKFALKNSSGEEGFAIPIAIGMGLIMILIASTMIVRSQGDQTTASAQKETNRALSAAETGITRYQTLINNNKLIAAYPRVGTLGWTTASSIPKMCAETIDASDVQDKATTGWRDVDSSNLNKGQYRLVNYVYPASGTIGTVGLAPGTGQLTVEGRVNQSGSSNTATTTATTATAQLVVKIPVIKQNLNCRTAALWIQNTPQDMGNNEVNGDILIPTNSAPSGVSEANLSDPATQDIILNPNATLPDTPQLPTSNLNTISTGDMNTRIWGETLPKTGDLAQPDGSFHYLIQGDLDNTGNDDINLAPNTKVVFYVQGDISTGGNVSINSGGYPQNVQIYGNTFQRNTDGTIQRDALNRPLTKYGCSNTLPTISSGLTETPASYTGSCPTTSLSANGGAGIRALIHAPEATGSIAGSGGGCNINTNPPTGGAFIGAIWIKKWVKQSNNVGPMICGYGNYSDYNSTRNLTQPSITSITSWERQEAN